jgi:alpha-mannosidase
MLKHYDITRRRIKQFTNALREKLYPARAPIQLFVHGPTDRIPYAEALTGEFRPTQAGEKFGPPWSTHWFRVEMNVPQTWRGKEVHLLWDSVSEGLIYLDGQPVQALTGTDWSGRPVRGEWRLPDGATTLTVIIEMAVNHLFGFNEMGSIQETSFVGLLRQAELGLFDRAAWDLLWDYSIVAEMAEHMPHDSVRGRQALFAANAMVNAIDLDDARTWPKARAIASKFLAARNGDAQHNVSAIGHAHIDTAWLWPLAETRRKVIRTVSTTLQLLKDYPEYRFSFSQAVQHDWVKEMQPELYAAMKQRVAEGRIVPVGGMWVEPDTNVPSGESLIRQLLIGQRWFRQEYGLTCREIWIPDVFGYCAQLPQIAIHGGATRFLTQKLSWNQINKPHHHTFYWEGLDGTRLLTHFPPTDTYNAVCTVQEALYHVRNYKDLERSNESYLLFGFGDGGGGPTPEMLERLSRMRDVDGLPRMAIRSSDDFFARLEADAQDLNTVVGELYFELHRGTYTSQARTKRGMRKSELLLHDVELIAAAAMALAKAQNAKRTGRASSVYPSAQLDGLWKTVLLNQFHDILPGSSIYAVYEDAHAQLGEVMHTASQLRDQAVDALDAALAQGKTDAPRVLTINTASVARAEVVELPAGAADASQVSASTKPLGIAAVGALGASVEPLEALYLRGNDATPVRGRKVNGGFVLENGFVRAEFKDDGALVSLLHKPTGRESLAEGARGNQFVLFDDRPMDWEAWDVDVFHLEKRANAPGAATARLVEKGPLRAAIEFTYQLSPRSTLRQVVYLSATSARLDFATEVDWHESRRFLKVEFPLNVRAQEATYDVQFGHLQRPTHFNTSYDVARFEVCGHKWADLSEPGFGVALLNDCKYGYAAHSNVLRLSLLRAPKYPDPEADMGKHEFKYALLPHAGSPLDGGVIEAAYAFNLPLIVRPTTAAPSELTVLATDRPNVIVETVKKAEDGEALIARLYEAHGARGSAALSSDLPIKRAWRCNGLEETETKLDWKDGLTLNVRPFEIITLKLEL